LSLQSKLFAFFIGIVVVPLTVAALLITLDVFGLLRHQDSDRVAGAAPGAAALYKERVGAINDRVRSIGADAPLKTALVTGDPLTIESALRQALYGSQGNLDFAMVLDSHNKLLAQVRGEPMYLPGVVAPTAEEMVATQTVTGEPSMASLLAAYTIVPVVNGSSSATVGTLVAGDYLDNTFAEELASSTGIDVTMVVKGQAVASSLKNRAGVARPWPVAVPPSGSQPVRAAIGDHPADAVVRPLQNNVPTTTAALMISGPLTSQARGQALLASILGFLIVAALGAALLGLAVTRAIARPLRELAKGANAIAAGDYDQHIEVRSADEVGQLARAFNAMTRRLAEHVAELQGSREELKRSLARFGETLRSTHDLDKILQVVLDTSVDALRASGGTLMVVHPCPGGSELTVAASRRVDTSELRLRAGEGIAGSVAVTGEPLRAPATLDSGGSQRLPDPAPVEPPFESAIWVPVFAQGRIFAVLSLFDREDDTTFSARDLDTVLSLADQAGVAIDNVVLHQEAQRLAITDGMTGIWNHRYFQLRFEQEMDRSARFRRPFCLLLCDIDDFKYVNDTYGHPQGDSVLIELARRVRSEVRDIDVLARYGGEEFVLILPETDADGGFRAAEKIRRRIFDSSFGKDRSIPVTISIGVACFPRAGTDQSTLLRAADVALYQAKALGKNRSIVFQPPEEGKAS
jgi:diguanylate cyclase (GGDEF)-like protein